MTNIDWLRPMKLLNPLVKISPCPINTTHKVNPLSKISYFPLPVNTIWNVLFNHVTN